MDTIYIKDVAKYENQEVKIRGWVYNKRSSGKLHFLQVRDGSAEIQAVVFKGDVSEPDKDGNAVVKKDSTMTIATQKLFS